MTQEPVTRDELKSSIAAAKQKNKTPLDKYECVIIVVALVALTAALVSDHLNEEAFSALMGAFMGYTFGRIFNGWQGKE